MAGEIIPLKKVGSKFEIDLHRLTPEQQAYVNAMVDNANRREEQKRAWLTNKMYFYGQQDPTTEEHRRGCAYYLRGMQNAYMPTFVPHASERPVLTVPRQNLLTRVREYLEEWLSL